MFKGHTYNDSVYSNDMIEKYMHCAEHGVFEMTDILEREKTCNGL